MSASPVPSPPDDLPSLAQAMDVIPVEPLLPAEKWLIAGSLAAGLVLLGFLLWLSKTYFPVQPGSLPQKPQSTSSR